MSDFTCTNPDCLCPKYSNPSLHVNPKVLDIFSVILRIIIGAVTVFTIGVCVWFGAKFLFFGALIIAALAALFVCWGLGMLVIEAGESVWKAFKR